MAAILDKGVNINHYKKLFLLKTHNLDYILHKTAGLFTQQSAICHLAKKYMYARSCVCTN